MKKSGKLFLTVATVLLAGCGDGSSSQSVSESGSKSLLEFKIPASWEVLGYEGRIDACYFVEYQDDVLIGEVTKVGPRSIPDWCGSEPIGAVSRIITIEVEDSLSGVVGEVDVVFLDDDRSIIELVRGVQVYDLTPIFAPSNQIVWKMIPCVTKPKTVVSRAFLRKYVKNRRSVTILELDT